MSKKNKTPVIIGMATVEERYDSMIDTVRSLQGQFDELHIYANDYSEDAPIFSKDDGIYWHDAPLGDLGDSAFMYPFIENPKEDAYCMIVGDDLVYPKDYVDHMISRLEGFDNKVAISLHGRKQFKGLNSYYRDLEPIQAINGLRMSAVDHGVTILGTAYACWHSSLIDFAWDDFPQDWRGLNSRNMGDIWFSKKLQEAGINRVAVKHKGGWVQHTTKIDRKKTIAYTSRKDDMVQTKLFNSVEWTL